MQVLCAVTHFLRDLMFCSQDLAHLTISGWLTNSNIFEYKSPTILTVTYHQLWRSSQLYALICTHEPSTILYPFHRRKCSGSVWGQMGWGGELGQLFRANHNTREASDNSEGLNERDVVSFEKDSPCMGALSGRVGRHANRTNRVAVKVGHLSHRLQMYHPSRRSCTHQSPDKR